MQRLFKAATIWSPGSEPTSALLVTDGIITAVGQTALDSACNEVIDLGAAFVMPAFADGHAHPLFAGREMLGPQIKNLQSVNEILSEVSKYALGNPDVPWIIGGAYEAAIIEQGDFDAHWLDSVVNDRPVVLHAVDHHTIWVNSKALEIAGIPSGTENPSGGTIARRENGEPKGTLREPAAIDLILQHAPALTMAQEVHALTLACKALREVGVTTAVDAWVEDGMAEVYITAAQTGQLSVDMNLCFLAEPNKWKNNVSHFNRLRAEIDALSNPQNLRASTIKFISDGALSAGTAALMEPYIDQPESTGLMIWSFDELLDALVVFDELNFQVHIHAIGDAAVRQALDAIEAMIRINPPRDRRPVIAHAQLIHPDDIARFAQLGIIANYQPLWTYLDPMNKELILPRLGVERNNRQYQLRTMIESGATISFGSDWPVTSQVPLHALAVPVHRQDINHQPAEGWSKQEAITIADSMHFYTSNVAYQLFREHEIGKLEVGMLANFIVLDQNPLLCEPHEVRNINVASVYTYDQLIDSK